MVLDLEVRLAALQQDGAVILAVGVLHIELRHKAGCHLPAGALGGLYEGLPEDKLKTSLSMTPAACASIEVSLAVSYLCGRASDLEGKLITGSLRDMHFDLLDMSFE